MPRLISAVLFVMVAPSAAMNYWIGNETSGVGNYVWAPRFAPLYGVSGDFNLTAPVEYYTGDLCDGLADDTPTKALSLKTLFDGKIVVSLRPLEEPLSESTSCRAGRAHGRPASSRPARPPRMGVHGSPLCL